MAHTKRTADLFNRQFFVVLIFDSIPVNRSVYFCSFGKTNTFQNQFFEFFKTGSIHNVFAMPFAARRKHHTFNNQIHLNDRSYPIFSCHVSFLGCHCFENSYGTIPGIAICPLSDKQLFPRVIQFNVHKKSFT
jgi:hypothetical protein